MMQQARGFVWKSLYLFDFFRLCTDITTSDTVQRLFGDFGNTDKLSVMFSVNATGRLRGGSDLSAVNVLPVPGALFACAALVGRQGCVVAP